MIFMIKHVKYQWWFIATCKRINLLFIHEITIFKQEILLRFVTINISRHYWPTDTLRSVERLKSLKCNKNVNVQKRNLLNFIMLKVLSK